jgi:hypothetical protein
LERCRLAEGASLWRVRYFIEGLGNKSPAPDAHAAFGFFIRPSIYKWCENPVASVSAVPLLPSLQVVGFPGSIFDKSNGGKSGEKRQHQGDIYYCRDVDRSGKQQ